jgi:hypothetical protein
LDISNIENNAWLAGFTDADGSFYISLMGIYGSNLSLGRKRVLCYFSITQIIIDKPLGLSCVPFITKIANMFQCNLNYKTNNAMSIVV